MAGPDGRIYVADLGLNRILAYTPDGELDTDWGDDGMSSRVNLPARIAIGPDDDLYAIELLTATIHVFDRDGQERESRRIPREPDSSTQSLTDAPTDIAVDGEGNLYVSSLQPTAIIVLDPAGEEVDRWDFDGVQPVGIALDSDDNAYVPYWSQESPDRGVQVIDSNGSQLADWTNQDLEIPEDRGPTGIAISPDDEILLVDEAQTADSPPNITRISSDGGVLERRETEIEPLPRINGYLSVGIAVDEEGRAYVPSPNEQQVIVLNESGERTGIFQSEAGDDTFARLASITTNTEGDLLAADPSRRQVLAFDEDDDPTLSLSFESEEEAAQNTGFLRTRSLVATNSENQTYVADQISGAIYHFDSDGELLTDNWAGDAIESDELGQTRAMAIDSRDRILIADDAEANVVKVLDAGGEFAGQLYEPQTTGAITDIATQDDRVYVLEQPEGSSVLWTYDLDGELVDDPVFISIGGADSEARVGQVIEPTPDGDVLVAASVVREGPEFLFPLLRITPGEDELETIAQLDIPQTTLPDLAISEDGTLHVASPNDRVIHVYEPTG